MIRKYSRDTHTHSLQVEPCIKELKPYAVVGSGFISETSTNCSHISCISCLVCECTTASLLWDMLSVVRDTTWITHNPERKMSYCSARPLRLRPRACLRWCHRVCAICATYVQLRSTCSFSAPCDPICRCSRGATGTQIGQSTR